MAPLSNAAYATAMMPPILKLNDKILDALAWALHEQSADWNDLDATPMQKMPTTRMITFEGVVRSSKTVAAIIAFHYKVQASGAKFHLIAGRDYDTISRNLIEAELGLMSLFPGIYRYTKDEVGSYYLEATTPNGIKRIILAGYSDQTRWKKVLGGSLECILIDEVNIADPIFVKECLARQVAALKPWTIYTLNGDDPGHTIYQEQINKSIIIGSCPAGTRNDMDRVRVKKRGYYYIWWDFTDNPIMTPEMIRNARTLYPIGSYYYKTKILGERGRWGSMIFTDYMTRDLIVDVNEKDEHDRPVHNITSYAIGMDVAGDRAYNVIALVGYTPTYGRGYLVDLLTFDNKDKYGQKVGYDFIYKRLLEFLAVHKTKPIRFIAIDSAAQPFINDLNGRRIGIEVIPSYKATIVKRIEMNCLLFSRRRFQFHTTTIAAYNAYQAARWTPGKEGKEREDKGDMINDIMDAVEYAETPYMTALTTGAGA